MCGILGVAAVVPQSDERKSWLRNGLRSMTHRGPDDYGIWWSSDSRAGLGHCRLAIIDLSAGGHQPMHLESSGLSIVFNGEIYNFRELRKELEGSGVQFRSSSDTEVLLAAYHAWGERFLDKLVGMFAIGLFDRHKNFLLLARDRCGEKPLFYRANSEEIRFSSELKGLLVDASLPRKIDPIALDCYLANGYVPGESSILVGYKKLPPGHALRYDAKSGKSELWCYWKLPPPPTFGTEPHENELIDELEGLLSTAISQQLTADVPVGVLLSGGVDSSLITAIAARHSTDLRTFTIRFPGHASLDETHHARLISQYFNTRQTELVADPSSASDLVPKLAKQYDEPIADSSMISTFLVSKLVRGNCTVALGGDGGDELFGGYSHYSRMLELQSAVAWLPLRIRRGVATAARTFLPVGFRGRNLLQSVGADFAVDIPVAPAFNDRDSRASLMAQVSGYALTSESVARLRTPNIGDLIQRATRMDFGNYLPDDILVKLDRASMLNSLEVRAPLLDHRIVEFAYGRVPSRLKVRTNNRKILLKQLASRLLPASFDSNRKQGFSVPLAAWLERGSMRELCWAVLNDPQCLFDRSAVRDLLSGQDRGRSNSERIFGLVVFELWRREYRVSI